MEFAQTNTSGLVTAPNKERDHRIKFHSPSGDIKFHSPSGECVAQLSWNAGELHLDGNADEAARMMIELMRRQFRSMWLPASAFPLTGQQVLLKTPTGLVEAWYVPAVDNGTTGYPAYIQTTCRRMSVDEVLQSSVLTWVLLDSLIGA